MTNLEKYLVELLADSLGCGVRKIRAGEGNCVTSCEDCIKENIEWLNAKYQLDKACVNCVNFNRIEHLSDMFYCKALDCAIPMDQADNAEDCWGFKERVIK